MRKLRERLRVGVNVRVCACVCVFGVGGHPTVPSNGRIELNRVEKGWRLLTYSGHFEFSIILSHPFSRFPQLPISLCNFPIFFPCFFPIPSFHLLHLFLHLLLLSSSLSSVHPFFPSMPHLSSLSHLPPPPSLSPQRRCNDSYLSVIRGPL